MKRAVLIEVVWLICVLVLTLLLNFFVLPYVIRNGVIDINLHDTYFEIKTSALVFNFFVLIGFVVNLIRCSLSLFKNQCINTSSAAFTALMILSIFPLALDFAMSHMGQANGWAVYPPSPVIQGVELPMANNHFFDLFKMLTLFRMALVAYLCFVSVRVGMGIAKGKAEMKESKD